MAARSRRALLDPRAAGTTDLIEPGATLVTDASDIIQTVAPILACARTTTSCLPRIREPTKRERLAGLLGPTPVSIDELIRMAGLSPVG